jgi:molybdopterin-containing oxidoreductase family iron-sulfur binding subunit
MKRLKKGKQTPVLDRRGFLKITGLAVTAAAAAQCRGLVPEGLLQSHFKSLSPSEVSRLIERLEREYREEYGRNFDVSVDPPLPDTYFGYALDIDRCIGCRRCVYGCVEENNLSREPQVHWIQVLEMENEKGIDFMHADLFYERETVPHQGHFYLPVACQQCENPPCVKTCPVKATWKEPDGMVVVDYNWCIGCRCCMAACPYGARHFNWRKPTLPDKEIADRVHYLGNRPQYAGVVGKCTFCIQRIRRGLYPKCVEVCPVGARKFGNLLDPDSEIRYILKNKRVLVLKEELNTRPKFYYFYGT